MSTAEALVIDPTLPVDPDAPKVPVRVIATVAHGSRWDEDLSRELNVRMDAALDARPDADTPIGLVDYFHVQAQELAWAILDAHAAGHTVFLLAPPAK